MLGGLGTQVMGLIKVVEELRCELQTFEDVVKSYITNFHLTEACTSIIAYWQIFAYVEILDKVDEIHLELKLL